MYEIMICPIKKLYELALEGDMSEVAVLAVSSYDINKDKLEPFCKTMCLNFDDITDTNAGSSFTYDIANEIADYIRSLPHNLNTLFICCDGGQSRSSAMGAAISRFNGLDEMKIWRNPQYQPNPLVYNSLCNALGLAETIAQTEEKVKINKDAFDNLINSKRNNS